MSDKYLDRKTVLNIVYTQQATRMADAYETLLSEVERLRKAGDELAKAFTEEGYEDDKYINAWNAAKDGNDAE